MINFTILKQEVLNEIINDAKKSATECVDMSGSIDDYMIGYRDYARTVCDLLDVDYYKDTPMRFVDTPMTSDFIVLKKEVLNEIIKVANMCEEDYVTESGSFDDYMLGQRAFARTVCDLLYVEWKL